MKRFLMFALALVASADSGRVLASSHASVTDTCNAWFCGFRIVGPISQSTFDTFVELTDKAQRQSLRLDDLSIVSEGGDIEAALILARRVRDLGLKVRVHPDDHCYSACVIVLAGGVFRTPSGEIGIHRPYFESGAETMSLARTRLSELREEVRTFLSDGGVRPDLWDDMIVVSPERNRVLSHAELERYGLWGADPAWEEKVAHDQMKSRGIDRKELNRRTQLGEDACMRRYSSDARKYSTCYQSFIDKGHE